MTLLMHRIKSRVTFPMVYDYVKTYCWPSRVGGSGGSAAECVSAKRTQTRKNGMIKFKCSASEALSFYPVFAFFLGQVVMAVGLEPAACASFMALCDVLDLLAAIPHGLVTAVMLQTAIQTHLELFKVAYGSNNMIPKHHFSLHLGQMLLQFGLLLCCFVQERRHKLVKRFANNLLNTSQNYERTLLAEITNLHLDQCARSEFICCEPALVAPVSDAPPNLLNFVQCVFPGARATTAFSIRYSHCGLASKHDVVLGVSNGAFFAGRVLFNLCIEGELMLCVEAWPQATPKEHGACVWRTDVGARFFVLRTRFAPLRFIARLATTLFVPFCRLGCARRGLRYPLTIGWKIHLIVWHMFIFIRTQEAHLMFWDCCGI